MILIVAALATWQIVEIWQHSSLLTPVRSRTEMWTGKLGELLGCPFCMSPWVALFCVICLSLPETGLAYSVLSVIVYAFAAARLANLGNDFFKQCSLTPKPGSEYEYDPDEETIP